MIETKIMKSDSGLENCFDLQFRYDEYLPAEDKNVDWSCYQYFTWLFKKHGLIVGNTNGEVIIYITHWKCEKKGLVYCKYPPMLKLQKANMGVFYVICAVWNMCFV